MGASALLAAQLRVLEPLAWLPPRPALAATPSLPRVQFDIALFIAPAQNQMVDGVVVPLNATLQGTVVAQTATTKTLNGVALPFRFGPVFTLFAPARLLRAPAAADQSTLEAALQMLEASFPFSPQGLFTFVAYGVPYFQKLPGGLTGPLVAGHMPRLLSSPDRLVLEEAVPGPTDVFNDAAHQAIRKQTFNVPVTIEKTDLLFTLKSDSAQTLTDAFMWLKGSNSLKGQSVTSPAFGGLLAFDPPRMQFGQAGLPRKVADAAKLPYAAMINPASPMWMGFADQHTDASGPADICTFKGNTSARLTTAQPQDYFADGSIQHLSHLILDLAQFYARPDPNATDPLARGGETYAERVQYMFRSTPQLSTGLADQFTNGGGPAYLPNLFQGVGDAAVGAAGQGSVKENRIGHLAAIQRSTRAADGTAVHMRMDGPGFNSLDVPGGSQQPTLEFTIFVPSSEFFRVMRQNSASLDLAGQNNVTQAHLGIERFCTATRRQNFCVPPRAHRAFPLLELAATGASVAPGAPPSSPAAAPVQPPAPPLNPAAPQTPAAPPVSGPVDPGPPTG